MQNMNEYDISLAVQTIRTLTTEAHSYEECRRLVWEPTDFWLKRFADSNPKEIICFRENPRSTQKEPQYFFCDIYLVAENNRVLYLGTIVNQDQAEYDFLTIFPDHSDELQSKDPLPIMRWWIRCNIPTNTEVITDTVIEKSVQRYFTVCAPKLAQIPIHWLPNELGSKISWEIFHQAKVTSKPQSGKEMRDTYESDM